MPRRAISPGLQMGLSITLNTQVEEAYCTGFNSVGIKGLLHVPVSQPLMTEYGFAISPGKKIQNNRLFTKFLQEQRTSILSIPR